MRRRSPKPNSSSIRLHPPLITCAASWRLLILRRAASLRGKGALIVDASLIDMADGTAPSVRQGLLSVHGGRVFAGCADGAFEVLSVKPDGKRLMDARSWSAGLRGQDAAWDSISE